MAVSRWCKSARCQGTAGESSSSARPALVEIGLSIAWARRIRSVLSRRYFGGISGSSRLCAAPLESSGLIIGSTGPDPERRESAERTAT